MILSGRQVVFGISVLLLGICCALPFQKTRPQPPVSDAQDGLKSSDEFIWVPDGVTLQVPGKVQQSPATSLYAEGARKDAPGPVTPPRILKHANLENRAPSKELPENSSGPLRPDDTLPVDSSIESGQPAPIRGPE